METLEKFTDKICCRRLTADESQLLPEIFKLRVACRQDQGYITPEKYPGGWFDAADKTAEHFAVFDDERLIAAARVNYYNQISAHSYFHYFDELTGYPTSEPIGYFSRVVVLPEYRLIGLSKWLVAIREQHALYQGIKHVLTDVCDFQIRNFLNYGYTNLGMLHSEKIFWEVKPEDYFLMYKRLG